MYKTYEEIVGMNTESLHTLISKGDAIERVWAAWQLAIRLGSAVIAEISTQSRNAPDPGTRCHLIVILAGLKETNLIKLLSCEDPDGDVRGTACHYLMALSTEESNDTYDFILRILNNETSRECILHILKHWNCRHIHIPINILFKYATIPDDNIREWSLFHITKYADLHDVDKAEILRVLQAQDSTKAIHELVEWLLRTNNIRIIIEVLTSTKYDLRIQIMDILVKMKVKFSWDALRSFTSENNPAINFYIEYLLCDDNNIDRLYWYSSYLANAVNEDSEHLFYKKNARTYGDYINIDAKYVELLETIEPKILPADKRKYFTTIFNYWLNEIKETERRIEAGESHDDYEDDDVIYVQNLKNCINAIRRWL